MLHATQVLYIAYTTCYSGTVYSTYYMLLRYCV